MKIPIELDFNVILKDQELKKEIYERLWCDPYFIEGFAELLVHGATENGSWPNEDCLARMRKTVLEGFEAHTQAELVSRVARAEKEKEAAYTKVYEMQWVVKEMEKNIKNAKISFNTETNDEGKLVTWFTLFHHGTEACSCSACILSKYLESGKIPSYSEG